ETNPKLKNNPNLDALRKALLQEPLEFFRKLRDQLQSDRDTRPDALEKLASANFDLALTTAEIGNIPDAIRSCSESIAILERLVSKNPPGTEYQSDLARSHDAIANLLSATGQLAVALESCRRAMAIRERLVRDNPTVTSFQSDLADSHNAIAHLLL